MLELFVTLSMRRQLKRFVKTGDPVLVQLYNDMSLIAIVSKVNFFTATFQILDIDEETWLAEEVMPIHCVMGLCTKSVNRVRRKLMIENGEHVSEECASETCEDE